MVHYNAFFLVFTRSSATKMLAGPVGRSNGIAFGKIAKVLLGCNKLKARDHQTWKMGPCKKNPEFLGFPFTVDFVVRK